MKKFFPREILKTKYIFFTGKGGVGKTSLSCATAVSMADEGQKVLLISTDPASNLQDVFSQELSNKAQALADIPNLFVANLDPIKAAAEYRESVVAPYRNLLPEEAIKNIEEQLSGSCTVEIAAFNEFSNFITDPKIQSEFDTIIFDTAPTGHTLRMLQLPSAWSNFISESTHGASCLGQLSGLEDRKAVYKAAVAALSDEKATSLVLVSRPEQTPLTEALRASNELSALGLRNQFLVINGLLTLSDDFLSDELYRKQQSALELMPSSLKEIPTFYVPLKTFNITGATALRNMLHEEDKTENENTNFEIPSAFSLEDVTKDILAKGSRIIFTMGKGGGGKTTLAAALALRIAKTGRKVHLTTTDPAAHLSFVFHDDENITLSRIDETAELAKYKAEVLAKAKTNGLSQDDISYIEEDLRSPCTQEIAVFRAFAEIVDKAQDQIIIIDTAPTGHTLLLLESTESYDHEIRRTKGETPESVRKLLPKLQSSLTQVIIVSLPEATPFYEASRLEEELHRAGLNVSWWIINQAFCKTQTENSVLRARATNEISWLNKVATHTGGNFALVAWQPFQVKDSQLLKL